MLLEDMFAGEKDLPPAGMDSKHIGHVGELRLNLDAILENWPKTKRKELT